MRIVITGAASGIGRAVAAMLLQGDVIAGPHHLLLVDRAADGLDALASKFGAAVSTLVADVGAPDCGDLIAKAAEQLLGDVDGLVSNAGFIVAGSLTSLSVEDYDAMFAVNARATWLIARALRPLMIDAGGGAIVATASMSAFQPTPPLGAYTPSKAALVMLVRQLANEWGPDGIRCNTVSPGPTLTAMTQAGYADAVRRAQREAGIPTRRLGVAEDVANAITFLLSERARQITGIDMLVDGGLSTTLMTASGAGSGQGENKQESNKS